MKTRVVPFAAIWLVAAVAACGSVAINGGSASPGAPAASESRSSATSDAYPASDTRGTYPPPATSARVEPIPCTMGPATVTAAFQTGGSLPAGPSAAPAGALAAMFQDSVIDRSNYLIAIVDMQGNAVATTKANLRSTMTGTCGNDIQPFPPLPLISTTAGRVYYLDGDTAVRYLQPDGTTGFATTVPGSSQTVSMFSVSPDDRRIAVAVFDYRRHPVADRLYVEDLGGGTNHHELPSSGLPYRWPVGWHGGNLIVGSNGTISPDVGFYAPLPYRIDVMQLLDPSSGRVIATAGDDTCRPQSSLPTAAGVACETGGGAVGTIDWTGKATIFATGDVFTGGASISPDGGQLLASGGGAILRLIGSPSSGSTEKSMGTTYAQGGGGYPGDGGWLDPTHAVYRRAGSTAQMVVDLATQVDVALPAGYVMAGFPPVTSP